MARVARGPSSTTSATACPSPSPLSHPPPRFHTAARRHRRIPRKAQGAVRLLHVEHVIAARAPRSARGFNLARFLGPHEALSGWLGSREDETPVWRPGVSNTSPQPPRPSKGEV